MTNNLISVIIPVYKVEKYLDKCVESVVNQTYKNLEIILVDDGSPDGCPAMCDEWAKKDSRIKVIHKANEGVAIARNAGMDNAQGEYITFVDSDDYIDETMYEKLLNKAKEENADMTLCKFFEVDENGNTRKINEVNLTKCNATNIASFYTCANYEEKDNMLYTDNIMSNTWRVLYKKNFIGDSRWQSFRREQDFVFNLTLVEKKPKIAAIDEYLYFYVQRDGSTQHSYNKSLFLEFIRVSKCILEKMEPLVEKDKLCAYKFYRSTNLLKLVFRSTNHKELLNLYKKDDWVGECICLENYNQLQKNTKKFKYKVANWLVYKKLYKLFGLLYNFYTK